MAGSFEFSKGQLILSGNGIGDWLKYEQEIGEKIQEIRKKLAAERSKPRYQRDNNQRAELREELQASIKIYPTVKRILCKGTCIISKRAFKDIGSLVELISDGIIFIEEEAFAGCTKLEKINIPHVNLIGKKAFAGCTGLKEINISEIEGIGEEAFAGCTGLEEINIPEIEGIGEEAFAGCTGLKEINIPEIKKIGKNAFKGCSNLKKIEGLAKLVDINSVYNLGCSKEAFENNEFVKLSKLKGSYREENNDIFSGKLYHKYKKFKEKCNNECKNEKAKKGAFKVCSRYFIEKVLSLMSKTLEKQVENVLNRNSNIKINDYFSDFGQSVEKKCLKVFNSVSATQESTSLRKEVNSEVRELQVDIKKYVSKKYNGLLSAGLEGNDISAYFGECFRVLLGFAGLEKFKSIDAKEVKRNKNHSSFALGGGGMDLLIAVKERELK